MQTRECEPGLAVMGVSSEHVLRGFKANLSRLLGVRLDRVVLFGSRARGDERLDSDFDIAVFISDMNSFGSEAQLLAGLETDILNETGLVFNAMPFPASSYGDKTSFMENVRLEGRDL
jgi:uncharacterized protein